MQYLRRLESLLNDVCGGELPNEMLETGQRVKGGEAGRRPARLGNV